MRIVIAVMSMLIYATSIASSNVEGCAQGACVAVVDVGSTGSRLHIYSYRLDENNSPITISERWSKKITPGFASLDSNKAAVDAYLAQLFAGAPKIQSLPVYFFSTAGMRLLSKPKQQQLYSLVQEWFNTQSEWQLVSAKTITGSEEGMFDWLAVNYQLGTLKNKDTVGVLDMGGASVQVVFPVKNAGAADSQDIQQVEIYGNHFTLFIHSFLGLGQTEVGHQFLDEASCFINSYELPTGLPAQGDALTCKEDVAGLINNVHKVNSVVQPAIAANRVHEWYVLGGLVDLVKSPLFNFTNQEFTNQNLLEKANSDLCHQQWSTLNAQNPGNDYLYGYCLLPSYFYALIVEGYGIPAGQTLRYLNATQSNDWTMGVVLHQPVRN